MPVTLEVHFKLTDLEYHPLPGAAVRLVFGVQPEWQDPDAGRRFVTDANGEHRFRTAAVIDQRLRKKPTNFVSSLLSRRPWMGSAASPSRPRTMRAAGGWLT
jgi:hypothetical protein